ncbi:hypothetical protein VNO78_03074 [Psophocarpus tetragonolobus]|uniref:Uncharacterized protein n=1 Tax=Psophocarpus tetragonolobus TaxID=3891 RepID=A0AAN9T2H2_PSOTE
MYLIIFDFDFFLTSHNFKSTASFRSIRGIGKASQRHGSGCGGGGGGDVAGTNVRSEIGNTEKNLAVAEGLVAAAEGTVVSVNGEESKVSVEHF